MVVRFVASQGPSRCATAHRSSNRVAAVDSIHK